MQEQIAQLNQRISQLENTLRGRSTSFKDMIRDTVFYDVDNTSSPGGSQTVVTGVDFNAKTVTTANIPTKAIAKFVRIYFRGQAYNVAVYSLS